MRRRCTGFHVGDKVIARRGDDWCPGTVSRSVSRGAEVDVRFEDGKTLRNITSKDVKPETKEGKVQS